jgi:hypothetical protein
MDGKTTLLILLMVAGEQLGRRFIHPYFGFVYIPLLLAAQVLYARVTDRGRRRRLAAIEALPPEEQRSAVDALVDEDERAQARLQLGLVDPFADGPQAADEEVFAYPRSWQRMVAWTYWMCLAMAAFIIVIGYRQNVVARHDFLQWLGLVLGFAGGAVAVRWSERQVLSRVFINVSGIGAIDPDGGRRIILWSELIGVRPRPWLTQVDFYGRGGTRRIVASFYLERFPRLMEMVSARLQAMEPPDSDG